MHLGSWELGSLPTIMATGDVETVDMVPSFCTIPSFSCCAASSSATVCHVNAEGRYERISPNSGQQESDELVKRIQF
eukprot:m.149776 g.149776  ORF g.149776 m.149776 type:complete len:77 (-) comp15018_c0_seq15:104-334(-)